MMNDHSSAVEEWEDDHDYVADFVASQHQKLIIIVLLVGKYMDGYT